MTDEKKSSEALVPCDAVLIAVVQAGEERFELFDVFVIAAPLQGEEDLVQPGLFLPAGDGPAWEFGLADRVSAVEGQFGRHRARVTVNISAMRLYCGP